MQTVEVYTDGGCHGNPGPGGWAAVLTYGEHRRELSGGAPATTNNRMEIQASLEALKTLKEPCEVKIYTDSSYLRSGVTSWIRGWKRNGWKTKAKQPVKNEDLWRELDAVLVGVAQVQGLADAVVGRALEFHAGGDQPAQGVGKKRAGGIQDGDMVQPGGVRRRGRAAGAFPGV